MNKKRLIIPVAVTVVGAATALAGIVRADAAEVPVCTVTYAVGNRWSDGFTGNVTIRNTGTTAVTGWTLGFDLGAGQRLAGGWHGRWAQSGRAVTVTDMGWNARITAGESVTVGFSGTSKAGDPSPAGFRLNEAACAVYLSSG